MVTSPSSTQPSRRNLNTTSRLLAFFLSLFVKQLSIIFFERRARIFLNSMMTGNSTIKKNRMPNSIKQLVVSYPAASNIQLNVSSSVSVITLLSAYFTSTRSKFTSFMISIKIPKAFMGILTLKRAVRTMICKVLIAPQSSCSKLENMMLITMLELVKPNIAAVAAPLIASIACCSLTDAYFCKGSLKTS